MDTGIGIKDEQKGKLFKSFGYIDDGLKLNVKGIGLGLSISKKIVTILGGDMKVESAYGEGSEFMFAVKIVQNEFKGHQTIANMQTTYKNIDN